MSLAALAAAPVPFAVACDQRAGSTDGDGDGDAGEGGGGDAGTDAGLEPGDLVFQVRAGPSWSDATPLGGSPARVDVGVVDWSGVESLTVTLAPEGYPAVTYAWLTEAWVEELEDADGTIHVRLDEPAPPPTAVTLGGTAVGMLDEGHYLTVSALGFNTYHAGRGPNWSVEVGAGEPLTLVALEFGGGGAAGPRGVSQVLYRWVAAEHPAITEDATMELDMGDPLETVEVSGSFTIPARGATGFFDVATPYLEMRSHRDIHFGAFVGFIARGAVTEPNVYEFVGEHAVVEGVDRPVTRYLMYLGELASNVYVEGYPDGPRETPFLEPPALSATVGALSWTMDPAAVADPSVRSQLAVSELSRSALTPCHVIDPPRERTTIATGEIPTLPAESRACGGALYVNVQLSEEGELWGEAAPVRATGSVYTSLSR